MTSPLPNVTLGDDLKKLEESIPCFLCRGSVEIKRDKHQKPYFICDGCGIQAFIRRKEGIRLLKELQYKSFSSLEVVQLTRELALLKTEKEKLSSQQGILFIDRELIKAEEAITQKIQQTAQRIKNLTEGEEPNE